MKPSILALCVLILGSLTCKESKEQSELPSLRRGSEGSIFEWTQRSDRWQAEAQKIADRKFTGLHISASAPHDMQMRYGVTTVHTMLPEIEKMALFVAEKTASVSWESGELRIEFTVYRGGHPEEDYMFRMDAAACRSALHRVPSERRNYILQNGTLAIRSGMDWNPIHIMTLTDTTTSFEDKLGE